MSVADHELKVKGVHISKKLQCLRRKLQQKRTIVWVTVSTEDSFGKFQFHSHIINLFISFWEPEITLSAHRQFCSLYLTTAYHLQEISPELIILTSKVKWTYTGTKPSTESLPLYTTTPYPNYHMHPQQSC